MTGPLPMLFSKTSKAAQTFSSFLSALQDGNKFPILGIILWFTTVYQMPQKFIWITFIIFAAFRVQIKNVSSLRVKAAVGCLITIAIISLISQMIYDYSTLLQPRPPFYILYIFTFFAAIQLTKKDFEVFFLLVAIEGCLVVVQYLMGVNTFFTNNPDFRSAVWSVNIYSGRPFGLSDSIPSMGYKIVVALLYFISSLKTSKLSKSQFLIFSLLMVSLMINFHRSSILGFGLFILAYSFFNKTKRWAVPSIASILVYISLALSRGYIGPFIVSLFGHIGPPSAIQNGAGELIAPVMYSSSYRTAIFKATTTFIENNLLFGNHCLKFFTFIQEMKIEEHAHNSFLQILATSGLFISLLYFGYLFIGINKRNWIWALPFFAISMTQYGIFWGISLLDVFFIAFLYTKDFEQKPRFWKSGLAPLGRGQAL